MGKVIDLYGKERSICLNAPRQMVIAGTDLAIQQVFDQALQVGVHKVKRLSVQVPSHCPLMAPVAERLTQAIEEVPLSPWKVPYISNSSARVLYVPDAIGADLALNVALPVRWYDTTTAIFELGARLFIEFPPGHVLTDLATEIFPEARAIALAKSRLDSVLTLIRRET